MEQSRPIPEEIKIWFIKQSHAPLTHRTYKEWARRGQELCYEVAYADGYQEASEAMYHRMAEEAQSLRKSLELAECEIKAMYKRVGINGSNVLDIVSKALEQYSSPVKPTDNGKGV